MSVLLFERSAAGRQGAWQAALAMAEKFLVERRRQRKSKRDRRHLMQLPDYLLKDIGVSRLEVERMQGWDDRSAFRRRA
jgi:uncharacterized protein YjiS (DUF1127 family)